MTDHGTTTTTTTTTSSSARPAAAASSVYRSGGSSIASGAVVASNVAHVIEEMAKEDHHSHCLICYDTLEFRALLPCGHNDVCPVCSLRLRQLHGDFKCPICKQQAEKVIVEETALQKFSTFDQYPIWGEELGSDFIFKSDVATFYRVEYYERVIQPLLGYHCLHCQEFDGTQVQSNNLHHHNNNNNNSSDQEDDDTNNGQQQQQSKKNPALRALQDHLRQKHRLQLCHLCVDHQRDFVSQLPRFTHSQIQVHLKQGDKGTAFTGHPVCEFCRPKRFYDLTALHFHLNQEHYKCDLCERSLGLPNQFFRHYPSLQRHFETQHFMCQNPVCKEARFVVFESELDLRHHERQVHGATSTGSSKIALEFRYNHHRGGGHSLDLLDQQVPTTSDFDYTLDGQAFVPSEMMTSSSAQEHNHAAGGRRTGAAAAAVADDSLIDPVHRARTEQLRQRAAQVAQERGLTPQQPEPFPSLQPETPMAAGAAAAITTTQWRAGWTSASSLIRVTSVPLPQQRKQKVGQVTNEEFPALGPSAAGPRTGASQRGVAAATTRTRTRTNTAPASTFAAISHGAHGGGGGGGGWGQQPQQQQQQQPPTRVVPVVAAAAPNLNSSDQFPSLTGGAGRPAASSARPQNQQLQHQQQPYAAARALASQNRLQQQAASASVVDPFPSLGVAAKPPAFDTKPQQQAPPQWDDTSAFPPPPGANNQQSVRKRMLGERAAPSTAATANVLKMNVSESVQAKATVDDLKATLGKPKYKELKHLTGEFAEGGMTGEIYVDRIAALFERGYGDSHFWSSVPLLVDSCPTGDTAGALRYLENLRRMKHGAMNAEQQQQIQKAPPAPPPSSSSSWPAMSAATAASTASQPFPSAAAPGKKNAAWGVSGKASVVRAQAKPGSVSVAASKPQQGPQSATQYMAQEQKKQKAAAAAAANKKKAVPSKQKQDLRQLAYGS